MLDIAKGNISECSSRMVVNKKIHRHIIHSVKLIDLGIGLTSRGRFDEILIYGVTNDDAPLPISKSVMNRSTFRLVI